MRIFNDNEEEKKSEQKEDSLSEKFLKTRQIILSGEINEENTAKVIKQLLTSLQEECQTLFIFSGYFLRV